ncbi:MAG: HNH endonuclease [Gemmatimonadota bacterium]|nr:HNH endonuclease [Gemmatimonadota bacterium]
MFYNLVNRTDVPERTDTGKLPKYNSKANRDQLYGVQGGDCAGCKTHFEKQHLTIDHIIARTQGGTDHIDNLQLLCHYCNAVKGDRGMEYLVSKLSAMQTTSA